MEEFPIPASIFLAPGSGQLHWVRDLAIAPGGHIWVTRHGVQSLTEFDPLTGKFSEAELQDFGVPDRISVAPDGRLWLTQASDAKTDKAFTRIAVFTPSARSHSIIAQQASHIAASATGVTIGGNPNGVSHLDAAGISIEREPGPFPWTASDLVATLPSGGTVLTNRLSSAAAVYDPLKKVWTLFKLQTRVLPVIPPEGITAPAVREAVAEVTDVAVGPNGEVWLAVPTKSEIVVVRP
jgi:hypothetical protein